MTLEDIVRAAAARWNCSEAEQNILVSLITDEARECFNKHPEQYTVDSASRAMAGVIHFQLRLPVAVMKALEALNQA